MDAVIDLHPPGVAVFREQAEGSFCLLTKKSILTGHFREDVVGMPLYDGYPLIPETETDGFTYGTITPLDRVAPAGAGFLQGPDGSRAGLQWEQTDSPYIMKIEGPGGEHWGVYRVGFTRPVRTVADLVLNLQALIPKLKVLYARARVH